jgi:hypothetical protein
LVLLRYPKFDELTLSYATKYHWNRTEIIARSVAPPGNSAVDSWFFVVYIRGWEVLGTLAATLGDVELEQECAAAAANLTAVLVRGAALVCRLCACALFGSGCSVGGSDLVLQNNESDEP